MFLDLGSGYSAPPAAPVHGQPATPATAYGVAQSISSYPPPAAPQAPAPAYYPPPSGKPIVVTATNVHLYDSFPLLKFAISLVALGM